MDIFSDYSIVDQEIVCVQDGKDRTVGISLLVAGQGYGYGGTEIILTFEELKKAVKAVKEEYNSITKF
jgi:hypothetical protein